MTSAPKAVAGTPLSARSILLGLLAALSAANAANWPQWRGPGAQGLSEEKGLPLRWSMTENIAWRCALPGKGNSSPIVWGDRVFLTAETKAELLVLCIGRTNGEILWQKAAPNGERTGTHGWNGYASSTPATDGERVYSFFGTSGLVAHDFEGKQLWHRPLGLLKCIWGTATSPYLDRGRLYLSIDHDRESFIAAVDAATGQVHWRKVRTTQRSFSSPVVIEANGSRELVLNGHRRVMAYNPDTGEELWHCWGTTQWVTPTVVHGHGLVFAACGRDGPAIAVRPGGKGDVTRSHVAWRADRGAPYLPSPLLYGDHFYMVNDNGVLACFEARTGKLRFRQRVGSRGYHTASLLGGDGKVYVLAEDGTCTVLKASGQFEKLATNKVDGLCRASMAVSGGRLFLRSQDALYCIGER